VAVQSGPIERAGEGTRLALEQKGACRGRKVSLTSVAKYAELSSACPMGVNPFCADFQIAHLLLGEKEPCSACEAYQWLLPLDVARVLLSPLPELKPVFC